MAKTGYGKRPAGDEAPHSEADFAHLGARDAEIATFIDHLAVGAAMGHKVIAAEHPRYGQQAVRTSMGNLITAGHLRWIKEHLTIEDNSMRWVTRTYWSREPKSAEWWAEFARERHGRDVTDQYGPGLARVDEEAEPEAEPEPAGPGPEAVPAEPWPEASAAHQALVRLRAADSRLALSERDCRALEPLAAEWLARGATPADLLQELASGLPEAVTNPGGFTRIRLENKMPPKPAKLPKGPGKTRLRARVTRAVIVCGLCEEPETSAELINGLCAECRAECGIDDEAGPPREFALEALLPGLCPVEPPVAVDEARRAAGPAPRGRG
ncbi:hypothetical protein [Streptomyces flavofungini]|uniref:hypothetical protein n=1 Tax=Streptomyces flavofungini TaxID=68200 RepID=UPI0025AFF9B9|nr:hypothetical protein [Streptomyces flavofungini]WJV47251.1 hypothetical protein QUY26_18045 [Streptomyces flavofungini]